MKLLYAPTYMPDELDLMGMCRMCRDDRAREDVEAEPLVEEEYVGRVSGLDKIAGQKLFHMRRV